MKSKNKQSIVLKIINVAAALVFGTISFLIINSYGIASSYKEDNSAFDSAVTMSFLFILLASFISNLLSIFIDKKYIKVSNLIFSLISTVIVLIYLYIIFLTD